MRALIHSVVVFLLVLCASTTVRVAGLAVTGSITDPSGAALPGVTVELISNAKVIATVTTDAHGAFEFRSVAPRRYELRARLNGFKELRTRVNVVGTTSPAPLRLAMQPESTRASAMVAGSGMLLRQSAFKGDVTWEAAELARAHCGSDPVG
jgi:protocatechuate 3,4-dioxygenase beta subunit